MPDVAKHAWTHRPRSQGGTDPLAIPSAEPFAYAFFSEKDLEDSTSYVLTGLSTSSYTGDGIADELGFGNEGETFMVNDDTQDMIWVVGDPCVVAFDVECYFADTFDAVISVWFAQANYGHGGYTSPVGQVLGTDFLAEATSPAGSHTVRLSGIVYMDPDPFDPDITGNGNSALVIKVRQNSGLTQQLTQGWVSLCRVTTGFVTNTYT